MTEIKLPPLPEWEESAMAVRAGEYTALQRFIYGNEPDVDFGDAWRDELQAALTEAIEADRRARQDEAEKLSRAKHYGSGYQDGWNSALEQAMKVIESISVPAGNSAAGELAFLRTMDNMREARDAIRALKREQS